MFKKSFLILIFLSILGCSDDLEEKQTPQKKPAPIEEKAPTPNPPNAQSIEPDKHISGGGQPHISGAPSSSHISGQ